MSAMIQTFIIIKLLRHCSSEGIILINDDHHEREEGNGQTTLEIEIKQLRENN